jgi:membrane protein YdbS with pleckstrin-like domain
MVLEENKVSSASDEKPCPYCGELIKSVAILCKHCKSNLAGKDDGQLKQDQEDLPEKVLYEGKLHWLIYFWPVFWILFFVPSFIAAYTVNSEGSRGMFYIMVLPIIFLVVAILRQMTSIFRITNQRVYLKTGLIARNTTEIPLRKIETVSVKQGLVGKTVDCGDVVLTGTGSSMKPLCKLAAPFKFRDALTDAMNKR